MSYKLAIFDMDGTILDTLEDLTDSTNAALIANGFPPRTIEEVRSFVGNGIHRLIELAVPTGSDEASIESVFQTFTPYYKTHCAIKTKPYDGILALLEKLRAAGVKTAVVSNKADFAVQDLCRDYFPGLFDFAVGEKDGIRRKPSPDSVLHVLDTLHIEKKDAVYIGDSDVDLKTSQNAGMDVIMVGWGFREEAFLKELGAPFVVHSAEEVYAHIVTPKISFASDYMEGAHPDVLKRLLETNLLQTPGYGLDPFCESAKEKIRLACSCPEADIFFLVGGTQTNATVIDAFLPGYAGVLSADTGHISVHEAGAIEASGHKVLTIASENGRMIPSALASYLADYHADDSKDHMVYPGMVYLSQPTEYGTLYSLDQLKEIKAICVQYQIPLYIDGARLAFALACSENNVTLPDLAAYCDAFYIGGTKCGALFGEAVVFPQKDRIPHFFTTIKQHGALLAKGRLLGVQFDALFTDHLYDKIGRNGIEKADKIRAALTSHGYPLIYGSPTNQVFTIADAKKIETLAAKVDFSLFEKYDDTHALIRFVASFATTDEAIAVLEKAL